MGTEIIRKALNRVEGDLEVKLQTQDGRVTDAWCIGTMYRGFEQLLRDRDALDSLVITPRICGICGTAHLYAAVTALETAGRVRIAHNGTRVRNICLMAEEIQSDLRQSVLMFSIDLCNKAYAQQDDFEEITAAFEVMKGRVYIETLRHTKNILEIVAVLGGQWPHSSYMIPGGVTLPATLRHFTQTASLARAFRAWYERTILGCSIGTWLQIKTAGDLTQWLNAEPEHRASAVGLFIRFGRSIGMQNLGIGSGNLLSYGSLFDPAAWQPPFEERTCYRKAGFYNAQTKSIEAFDPRKITEDISHAFYTAETDVRPLFDVRAVPHYNPTGSKYSWSRAPRYAGDVVEVGPLAELLVDGDPLVADFFAREGSNSWLRQFCRFHRPALTLNLLEREMEDVMNHLTEPFYLPAAELSNGRGMGLLHAARGPLGHWVEITNGKISQYQVVSPTTWNASPRDAAGRRGHWEESLIGLEIRDASNPIELQHVIRSHDPCLVCSVHFLDAGNLVLGAHP